MPDVQMNASPVLQTKRVWYKDADQLEIGYTLCYDDAATIPSGIAAGTNPKTERGRQAAKPTANNQPFFAGFVSVRPVGVGPCFVDIYPPAGNRGEFVSAFTKANMTLGVTALKPAAGVAGADGYALIAHADATLNLPMCAMAAETVDTSAGSLNKLVRFL